MKTRIITMSLLASVALLTSCEKVLEETVYSKLTDELAFSTGANAQAATDEMYESLHSAFRTPYFYINDMATDCGYRAGKEFETLNDEAIKTSSENESFWTYMYKVASRANIVLDNIPDMDDSLFGTESVSTKDQMLAEAHFMRAFAYMGLTDAYYQVPLVTTTDVDVTAPAEYTDINTIEKAIEEDLLAAIPVLPLNHPVTEASRPTKGAAMAYLCRLYMRKAGRARVAGEDASALWKKALDQVNAVLDLEGKEYYLLPKVADIYVANTEEGKYNKEIIFAVRATDQVTTGSWDIGLSWTPWDCNYGWSTFSMPLELAWSFPEGDARFASDMVFTTYSRYLRTDKPKYANCMFFFPTSIEKVGLMIKEWTGPALEAKSAENDAVYTRKYEYYQAGSYNYDTPNNVILCRFADMILCKAEILNELNGPSAEAVALLNRIRSRAGISQYNASAFATKDALRSALCDERAWEFHSEGLRRPDLIRMGLWSDRMNKYIAAIKEKAGWKERNEGRTSGYYESMYVAYPKNLTEDSILKYMPVPSRELNVNPDLSGARDF
ncbi:MAG: RagB/SusD family nutrient uptake outer membrane protein [Bacteroidales bacterium]|nr:RagB/SusD family nutrient uptake outer membrane protein [Bacteroidales bacterium]